MPPGDPSPRPSPQEPARPFRLEGSIPRRPVPAVYRLTLALSAFALILLPLVYVGLIVAAGWGVWLYAIHGTALFQGSGGGIWKLIAYVGPLAAGAILIVFMVKPLFARQSVRAEPLILDLEQEPTLRDLIRDICAQVRAPMPSLVNVDCQVNASARLRRGWVSLGRKDLALTIGLPLAANLSARQLAGVLAHEFGHFAQGGGMALTYVIRSINAWFARVVFERDHWDEQLEAWSNEADVRIGIILKLARGAVWVSRRILHGLMYVGHVITCLQLRQMEYDADYYETHVAGSADFAGTSHELARLGVTQRASFDELGELWSQRRLVDDFPGFVAVRRAQLDPAVAEKITAAQLEGRTGWLDTHPSDRDRIAQAQALGLPGIFQGDGPAAGLFRDFPGLCRDTTRHYYRDTLELAFDDQSLVPVAAAARAGEETKNAEAAQLRLTGQVLNLNRPLVWQETDFAVPANRTAPALLARQFAVVRAELTRAREAAEAAENAFGTLHADLENARYARAFLADGIGIQPRQFNLVAADLAVAERRIVELNTLIAARVGQLAPFESAVRDWIRLVVQSARVPEIAARLAPETPARVEQAARALAALRPWFEAFPGWMHTRMLFNIYAGNVEALRTNHRFLDALDRHRSQARALPTQALGLIGEVPHPFAEAEGVPTVAAALEKALVGVDLDGRSAVLLRLAVGLYFRLLGRLALAGEEIEKLLAAEIPGAAPGPAPDAPPPASPAGGRPGGLKARAAQADRNG